MYLRSVARIVALGVAIGAFASFGTIGPAAQTSDPARYTIEDVGIPDAGDSYADAIDDNGTVVGTTVGTRERAFRFDGVASVHLDTIGGTLGGARSSAQGVIYSTITGWSNPVGSTVSRGFVFDRAGTRDIGTLGGAHTFPRDTDGIWIAGTSWLANGDEHAFLTDGGVLRDLGTLGGRHSYGWAVNGGWVAGASYVASGALHAFLFNGSSLQDLGTLGGRNSVGRDLNEWGHVTGYGLTPIGDTHAFLHDGTAMKDLATLGGRFSDGFGINEYGHIVGESTTATGALHAFLYRDQRMVDLNSRIDPALGWVLMSARDINRYGQITGHGTFQGKIRAFRLSPPNDIAVYTRGVRTDLDGNLPNPVQAGRHVTFVLGVENTTHAPADVTVVDTVVGPVEVVSAGTWEGDPCNVSGKTVTCSAHLSEAFGQDFYITVRTTAAGVFGHSAVASSAIADLNASNNSVADENTAVSLSSVAVTPSTIAGGKTAVFRVFLTSGAPGSGSVTLTSSNPEVASIRSSLVLINRETTRATNIVPKVVAVPTTVDVTATFGLVSRTATLTIVPPSLLAFYLSPTTVIGGCRTTSAKVTLTGSGPTAGASVILAESIAAAQFPATLVVAGGTSSVTKVVSTSYVTAPQVGTVTASFGGVSKAITFTVRPIRASSITLTPNPVIGGNVAAGTVTLECASPVPVVVPLSSGSSLASPTVSTITIPAGQLTGSFTVRTTRVAAATTVPIYARVYNVRKSATLTLNP